MEGKAEVNTQFTKNNDNGETQLTRVLEFVKEQQQYDYSQEPTKINESMPLTLNDNNNNNSNNKTGISNSTPLKYISENSIKQNFIPSIKEHRSRQDKTNTERKTQKQKFPILKKFTSPNIEINNVTLLSKKRTRSSAGLFNKGKSSALGSNDMVRNGVADLVFSEASFLNNDSHNSKNKFIHPNNSPLTSSTTQYNRKLANKENIYSPFIQDEATRFFNSIKKLPDHHHPFNSFHSVKNFSQASSTHLNKKNDDGHLIVQNDKFLQSLLSPPSPPSQQIPNYTRGITPQKYSPKTYIHPAPSSFSSFNEDENLTNNNIHLSRLIEPWESTSVNHQHHNHRRVTVISPSPHYPSFSFSSNDHHRRHYYRCRHPYSDINKKITKHIAYPTIIEPNATTSKNVIGKSIHPTYRHIPQQPSSLNQQQYQQNTSSNMYNDYYNYHHHHHQQQQLPLFTSSSSFIKLTPIITELESVTPFIPNKHLIHHHQPSRTTNPSSSSIYIPPHLLNHHSTIFPINGIITNINKKYDHDNNNFMNDTITTVTASPFYQYIQNNRSDSLLPSSTSSNYLDMYSLLTETAAQSSSTKLPYSTSFKL